MKRHTSKEWLDYLGIDVIDPDGWRAKGQSHLGDDMLTAEEFAERWYQSTCRESHHILFETRREVFDFVVG